MTFVKLPVVSLVSAEEVARLHAKFDQSRAEWDHEAFWQAIQDSKQPRPVDYAELGVLE